VPATSAAVPLGDYVFSAHRWSFNGLKSEQLLAFRVLRLGEVEPLNGTESEALVVSASREGTAFPNAGNVLPDTELIYTAALACDESLADGFAERLADFAAAAINRRRAPENSPSVGSMNFIDGLLDIEPRVTFALLL
jgi:hypothetical protein